MASPGGREQARLLLYIGIAGAVLCVVTVVLGVLVGIFGPLFTDRPPGDLDPTIAFLLLAWAGVALGFIPASAFLSRRRNNDE